METKDTAAWEQLYSLQQEYERLCRKAWALRSAQDAQQRAALDCEVNAVLLRVAEVFRGQQVPQLYS